MIIDSTQIFTPAGIVTGAAYSDKDAIGTTAMAFTVPITGIIETALYFDLDDEGLAVDLWLFSAAPAAQTDNGAFSLTDAELQTVVGVISFATANFSDQANGQVGTRVGLGMAYKLPTEVMYAQLQARGALNLAASNLPTFKLVISRHDRY